VDPRAARRQARLDEVLEAAWEIARAEGLAAVSLHEVARRVGLRQPSLYSYFPSKSGLYDAMFAQGYRELIDHVGAMSLRAADPRRGLVELSRAILGFITADAARQQLLFHRTIPGFTPSVESYALAEEFLAFVTERLCAAGITGQADVDIYTALIGGLGAQQVANDPGGKRWTKHLSAVMAMFFAHIDSKQV
jgi:AcrR family transcriptional regulator